MTPTVQSLSALEALQAPRLPEAPVYLLLGPDDFLREQVLERLRSQVLDPGFADFNHVRLHCTAGSKVGPLANALVDLPMMADRRLVEIQEAQALPAEVGRALAGPLEEACRAGGTVVAVCWRPAPRAPEARSGRTAPPAGHRSGAPAKPPPLLEAAGRLGRTIACSLAEEQRPAWVQEALARRGVQAEPAAVREILVRTGGDLRHLASQLDKLALYAGPSGRVGVAEVRQVVLRSVEVKTWTLTAAIGKKNLREAVGILGTLLEDGEPPGGLLSYVNSYLRGLAQVHSLSARLGPSAAAIAREMKGKQEFQVRKTLEELRTWSEAELRLAFDMACRADLRIKTGADPRLVLELLLVQLCSRRGPARR